MLCLLATHKPTIIQHKTLVIPRVSQEWRRIGVKLPGAGALSKYKGSNEKCCLKMFQDWLHRNPYADWYQLLNVLDSVQLKKVADDIRNKFTGEVLATCGIWIMSTHVTRFDKAWPPYTQQQGSLFTITQLLYTLTNSSGRY